VAKVGVSWQTKISICNW